MILKNDAKKLMLKNDAQHWCLKNDAYYCSRLDNWSSIFTQVCVWIQTFEKIPPKFFEKN